MDLNQQLLNAYLFLREHNHSIPDEILEFIKNSGDMESDFRELEVKHAQLLVDNLTAKRSKVFSRKDLNKIYAELSELFGQFKFLETQQIIAKEMKSTQALIEHAIF